MALLLVGAATLPELFDSILTQYQLCPNFFKLEAFYTDIIEEPLVAGRFLVYSGPTVLLMLDGREVYRTSGFIDFVELERKVDQLEEVCDL